MGLDLHYFWSLNPKQYAKHCKAFISAENKRIKEQDALNHMLGKYISIGVNNPKDYPTRPYMDTSNDLAPMSDEQMEQQARRNTIKLGGAINDS